MSSESCPRILYQELIELTSEIKDFSAKNHKILAKIKAHDIPEVLRTLPSSLFNIETFSALSQQDIAKFDRKTAEKLKAKALSAFDILMNEEVLLERIQSKCSIIGQVVHQKEREKAIHHLAVDLIPSFLPYNQKKYTKFVKSSQKLISEMGLKKKSKFKAVQEMKVYKDIENEEKDLEARLEEINQKVLGLTENFLRTTSMVNEDIANIKEVIKLDDLQEEKEKYKKLTLDSFSSASSSKEQSYEYKEVVKKIQEFQADLHLQETDCRKKSDSSSIIPFESKDGENNNGVLAPSDKENLKNQPEIDKLIGKLCNILDVSNAKETENMEEIIEKIDEKARKLKEDRENCDKEAEILNIERELLKIEWDKLENQKKELLQMEKLKKIEQLSKRFLKS